MPERQFFLPAFLNLYRCRTLKYDFGFVLDCNAHAYFKGTFAEIRRALGSCKYGSLLSVFHKVYYCQSSFAVSHIKPANRVFSRLDHAFKVQPLFAHTNLFFFLLLLLVIRHWNQLPGNIITLMDNDSFIKELQLFLNV